MTESCGKYVFHFLKNCQDILQSDCSVLYSYRLYFTINNSFASSSILGIVSFFIFTICKTMQVCVCVLYKGFAIQISLLSSPFPVLLFVAIVVVMAGGHTCLLGWSLQVTHQQCLHPSSLVLAQFLTVQLFLELTCFSLGSQHVRGCSVLEITCFIVVPRTLIGSITSITLRTCGANLWPYTHEKALVKVILKVPPLWF